MWWRRRFCSCISVHTCMNICRTLIDLLTSTFVQQVFVHLDTHITSKFNLWLFFENLLIKCRNDDPCEIFLPGKFNVIYVFKNFVSLSSEHNHVLFSTHSIIYKNNKDINVIFYLQIIIMIKNNLPYHIHMLIQADNRT